MNKLKDRNSGVLMHISSLHNKYGIGSLGEDAREFVDFLSETKQSFWQILPIGPTGYGNSPYQSYSVFAVNPLFINPEQLVKDNLLTSNELDELEEKSGEKIDFKWVRESKSKILRKAFVHFKKYFEQWKDKYYNFLSEHSWWLTDYALFMSLTEKEDNSNWSEWDSGLKYRDGQAINAALHSNDEEINFRRFEQFILFKQWFELKKYANSKGILILGDLPLYVSYNSSDVWGNQDIFELDANGKMTHVSGVPPDYFSEIGQLWGSPVFNWNRLEERQYDWWMARIHFNLKLFDYIRIDHFRGLESFWSIPANEKTAVNGFWVKAKGYEMLNLLKTQIGKLPIIAEDLGLITNEVVKLREKFKLSGMKVLQFAYAENEICEHLPHNFQTNFVVYTGTHDNNTTLGWIKSANKTEKKNLRKYFNTIKPLELNEKLIEAAWSSVAELAIVPMQDLLELESKHRMNTPGTTIGNWEWRMEPKAIKKSHKIYLSELTKKYNR